MEGNRWLAAKWSLALSALIGLSACGGGSSGSGSGATTPPPTVNANPAGVWYGYVNNATLGDSYDVVGVSISSGELRFVDSQGVQYHGTMQVAGNNYTATFRAIAPLGETFLNNSTVITGSLNGTIQERSTISGSYTMSTGETGAISLLYDPVHLRGSNLSRLAGIWTDEYGETTTIDSQGQIFAQTSDGCVFNGSASVVSSAFNTYRFNVTVSSCGTFNGTYGGLGVISDWQANDDNRLLTFQLSNNLWSITSVMGKL